MPFKLMKINNDGSDDKVVDVYAITDSSLGGVQVTSWVEPYIFYNTTFDGHWDTQPIRMFRPLTEMDIKNIERQAEQEKQNG